jgi:RNA polymerase sigma-70 factor (ECF subfamily)
VVRNQSLKRRAKRVWVGEEGLEAQHHRSPESQVLQTEMEETVALAVAQLPEGQREVLILAHYEQMPLAEIARVVEAELTTVKSRLQRARAHLKETLATYAPGTERKR